MARATASCSTCSDGDCRSRFFRPRLPHAWGLWPQVCTGMTWETPFPRSRMPASFEKFIKALHCLQCRAKAILTPSPAHAQSLHAPGSAAEVRRSDGSAQMGYESPAQACAVATRAEVSLSGPASCSCSSRARSIGAALPPLELRRAWHARGRWPPAEVGRAGARWQGMQAGGGAGRQAGRRLGAEERRAHLPLPTAAALPRGGWLWHGSRRRHSAESALNACQLLSTEIPSLACGARRRAMLAGWRCSPPTARDARAYCAVDLSCSRGSVSDSYSQECPGFVEK